MGAYILRSRVSLSHRECNGGIRPGVTRGGDVRCPRRLTQRDEHMESGVEANMDLTFRHKPPDCKTPGHLHVHSDHRNYRGVVCLAGMFGLKRSHSGR